jgi:spermidine synthase
VICFGTGQTANALRREGIAELDVVELSSSVLELADLFPINENVLDDPRVEPIVMDGRAWLRRTDRLYDVITLEPMPPNFAGVNALYSREFYETLAERLRPGGIATQWLPIHMLSPHHAASIVKTFQSVFPDALLWYDPVGSTGILVGRITSDGLPLGREWPGLDRIGIRRDLGDAQIRKSVWLRSEALSRYGRPGQLITDDNQLLQWSTMRPRADSQHTQTQNQANKTILKRVAGRPAFSLR